MRHLALAVLATAMLSATAQAQDWKVYSYPERGFAIQLPVAPSVEHTRYTTATGASLPMTRYSAAQDGLLLSLEIVDYSGTGADGERTIAEAEKSFGTAGKVTVAIDARVNREYGRELSVNGSDGSRSAVALFFVDGHLFRLEGKSLPPDAISRSADTIRFQESLQFIGANGGFGGFRDFGRSGDGRFGRADRFGGPRGGPFNSAALTACQGKAAGDSVQIQTPAGPVPASCILVARPTGPSPGEPPNP